MFLKSWRDRDIQTKKGRDGGINRKKWAGKRDLRTLLWTLVPKPPGKRSLRR